MKILLNFMCCFMIYIFGVYFILWKNYSQKYLSKKVEIFFFLFIMIKDLMGQLILLISLQYVHLFIFFHRLSFFLNILKYFYFYLDLFNGTSFLTIVNVLFCYLYKYCTVQYINMNKHFTVQYSEVQYS